MEHHRIFYQFERKEKPPGTDPRYFTNFLGVKTAKKFIDMDSPNFIKALEVENKGEFPRFSENYFEWIDLLEAVAAAKGKFVMFELGAGWGNWIVNAALAVKRYHGALPYTLVGVEAEPTHFKWMGQHLRSNGIDPSHHELLMAAVSDKDGTTYFPAGGNPAISYSQAITDKAYTPSTAQYINHSVQSVFKKIPTLIQTGRILDLKRISGWVHRTFMDPPRTIQVKTICLKTLLRSYDRVDLIDMDVQGAEYSVLDAAKNEIDAKVKKIHIGTHGPGRHIEKNLRVLFHELGWENKYDFENTSRVETEYGPIQFSDGIQSWSNPKLIKNGVGGPQTAHGHGF